MRGCDEAERQRAEKSSVMFQICRRKRNPLDGFVTFSILYPPLQVYVFAESCSIVWQRVSARAR